ncbi:ankyrin [Rostrohypoxylon terebratum]|nr:ankyrin [Rostrohypoxylon terebratum]
MDPLSIIASTIALAQAIRGIAKGVHFLRSLGHIPLEYSGLLNELSTLQASAEQVQAVLQELESPSSANLDPKFQDFDLSILVSLKDDLAQTTEDFDALCGRLKAPKRQRQARKSNDEKSVSKWRWEKEKYNITRLQQKSRRIRQELGLCFAALATSQAYRNTKFTISIQEALYASTRNITLLQKQCNLAREENWELHRELQGSIAQLNQHLAKTTAKPAAHLNSYTLTPMVCFQACLVPTCSSACKCGCHLLKRLRSPSWLSHLIGNLFLEYNTIPLVQPVKCDVVTCKAKLPSSFRLYYAFPRWFLGRSIELAASWSSLTGSGSSLHLRVPRVLMEHGIWSAIRFGDMRWIQVQMAKKNVLPTDVGSSGMSLAIVALGYRQFEMARYFIQKGCDIHAKDMFGRTVLTQVKKAVADINNPPEDLQALEEILSLLELDTPWYLDAVNDKVDPLLSPDLANLNRLDDCGFAPLHWAIWKEDRDLVLSFLEAGAEPNLMTSVGATPLTLAVNADLIDIVELLLNHGADVDFSDPGSGERAICGAFKNPQMLRLLLDHKACVTSVNKDFGSETPLDRAASYYHDWVFDEERRMIWAESLSCLIGAGLDINNQENPRRIAPIMNTLWNRNAILLDLLISAGARLDIVDIYQEGVLHYAAVSSPECIEILRRAQIDSIDPDRPNDNGETPTDYMTQRMYTPDDELDPGVLPVKYDEFWAFQQLIDEIRARHAEKKRLVLTDTKNSEGGLEMGVRPGESSKSVISDSNSSVAEYWVSSRMPMLESGEGGIVRASSDCGEYEEFFDSLSFCN